MSALGPCLRACAMFFDAMLLAVAAEGVLVASGDAAPIPELAAIGAVIRSK